MKRIYIIIVSLILSISVYSQSKDSIRYLPKYSIGISPTSMMNVYRGVQISQDLRVSNIISFTLESAYIFESTMFNKRRTNGVRLRTGIEFLISNDKFDGIAIGIFYLKRYITEDFKIENYYRERKYVRRRTVKRIKDLTGIGMNLDFKQKVDDRLRADFGFGLGLGTLFIEDRYNKGDFGGEIKYEGWYGYDSIGNKLLPILIFNVNFSYAIFK